MVIESLTSLYQRDLDRLKNEIEAYQQENNLWKTDQKVTNSAGNLCLHLIGNLNQFIGAQLGNTNYVRQRELEFSTKDVPRIELIEKIKETAIVVDNVLNHLTEEDLNKEYSRAPGEEKMSTTYFLIHYLAHLDYHLGQINFHRRLLDI
ncbi:DinB superfamily protein [Chryseobacterium artocarpi]|uniref:DinB superfamily protein n=1 Tax=Chryseobacterium artocarpi TaxID=1414727 RepID=A0A1B8ZL79_9FLAO|nr:DinB family protein [Chryseobacterium artocarpi]OCA72320.1 DinB superfamily protein [Chryseobacterium artocarpi]